MKKFEHENDRKDSIEFGIGIMQSGKLLATSDLGENRVNLYRKGMNHYLVYLQENRIVKVEKVSRNLAHMQFPSLIVH
jgi:hypothetical protein